MSLAIQTSAAGARRAERAFTRGAERVSAWGLDGGPSQPYDTLQLDGVARPRRYGTRPPRVSSLSQEVVQMKQAEHAYRANLSALRVSLKLDDALLEVTDEREGLSGAEER